MKLLGIDKQMDDIRHHLTDELYRGIIVYGPTGCGKTAAVNVVCKEEGLKIIDLDPDDLPNFSHLIDIVAMKPMEPSVFVIDNIAKIDNKEILKVVNNAKNKIIFISDTNYIFSKQMRELCYEIRFFAPSGYGFKYLVEHAKNCGIENFSDIHLPPDFRQVEYMGKYGSDGYHKAKRFYDSIKESFGNGSLSEDIEIDDKVPGGINSNLFIIMLENSVEYYGIERIELLKKIIIADYCRRHEPLHKFGKKKISELRHYYIDKKKELRRMKNE